MSQIKKIFKKFKRKIKRFQNLLSFRQDFKKFRSLGNDDRFSVNWSDRYPFLDDKTSTSPFDSHYIYHTAWAARILAKTKPVEHVDISSALYFSTIISAFTAVRFFDLRPANLTLDGLVTAKCDITSLQFEDQSISSLSCMSVVEHIGLGRYGDPLDPDGDLKAIKELLRVLAKNGNLLFVVPVGRPRIRFNAHRIYSCEQIKSYFSELTIQNFALIDDKKEFHKNAEFSYANAQDFGCGCFWLKRT